MTTFLDLKTAVSAALNDPSNQSFTADDIAGFVNSALVEIGRIAPERFQEDITPVADQLEYPLRSALFAQPVSEIEVLRVELWDGTTTPPAQLSRLNPLSAEYESNSQNGWEVWDGTLRIPNIVENIIDPGVHFLKVWGYSPYPPFDDDADVVTVGAEKVDAIKDYCRILGLRRLVLNRDLFTQWQTHTNATDVSPAALMNGLAQAEDSWRRRARSMLVTRGAP